MTAAIYLVKYFCLGSCACAPLCPPHLLLLLLVYLLLLLIHFHAISIILITINWLVIIIVAKLIRAEVGCCCRYIVRPSQVSLLCSIIMILIIIIIIIAITNCEWLLYALAQSRSDNSLADWQFPQHKCIIHYCFIVKE